MSALLWGSSPLYSIDRDANFRAWQCRCAGACLRLGTIFDTQGERALADRISTDSAEQTINSSLGGRRFIPWQQTGCFKTFLCDQRRKGKLRLVRLGNHTGVLLQDWLKFIDNLPTVPQEPSKNHQKAARERWRKAHDAKQEQTPASDQRQ